MPDYNMRSHAKGVTRDGNFRSAKRLPNRSINFGHARSFIDREISGGSEQVDPVLNCPSRNSHIPKYDYIATLAKATSASPLSCKRSPVFLLLSLGAAHCSTSGKGERDTCDGTSLFQRSRARVITSKSA
jgi:hypothetical protein